MKAKLIKKIALISTAVIVVAIATILIIKFVNKDKDNGTYFDNEKDALVFSTLEVDKVFNPFFSTSATDSNVVGMTQIGMLGNNHLGEVTYGDDEAVVTKDLQIVTEGTGDNQKTTYYFVLKNNVRFSNGSYLTIKDVLFNLYVYLDPVYSGSSTIYSTDIVGLNAYRTQASDDDKAEQDNFNIRFQIEAESRIEALLDAKVAIYDDHSDESISSTIFKEYLQEYSDSFLGEESYDTYKNLVADFNKATELFKEELENDYTASLNSYQDTVFTDDKGAIHRNLFTTDVEQFLYNEGYITWNKKDAQLSCSLMDMDKVKNVTRSEAINWVLSDMLPSKIDEIIQYWATSTNLYNFLVNEAIEEYFKNNTDREIKNISGIKFCNQTESVVVNGVTYEAAHDANGNLKEGCHEVLSITINGIDPKAIWNFAFTVAPMYYYSNAEQIAKFDFESNFGVEYGSQTFMNEVVKDPNKIGVPVGAGPYAASKASGGIENISSSDFYSLGIIYFERNPYYIMGPATIKKIRYQVVSSAQMLNSLYNGEVDFVEPNAKPETISELDSKKDQGIGNQSIQTSGYGYIGINAAKVPSIKVRQAIMHAINTQECVDYYETTAEAIYRPMSKSSWAYPEGCTPYYPYIGGVIPEDLSVVNPDYRAFVYEKGKKAGEKFTEEEQLEFLTSLVESAGYSLNSEGIYQQGTHQLKYVFTVAGQETDHPAWRAMEHAMEILNKVGFNVRVQTDANALNKLASGALTVWAAAWGSTIDPDMYQVYHIDSKATSTLNWGYNAIKQNNGGKYDVELGLVRELSDLIDQARETNDQTIRQRIYKEALDIVMQLAIELPTYQRDDLFAFNTNKIDVSTFTPQNELSPYKGLTGDIHLVSLNKEE